MRRQKIQNDSKKTNDFIVPLNTGQWGMEYELADRTKPTLRGWNSLEFLDIKAAYYLFFIEREKRG